MQNLTIGRFNEDPQAQGVVKPEDGRWQLVIDRDGFPHLWLQADVEGDDGKPVKGMVALDDLLPEGLTVRGIMSDGIFGGRLTAEEEAWKAAYAFQASSRDVPCPRL